MATDLASSGRVAVVTRCCSITSVPPACSGCGWAAYGWMPDDVVTEKPAVDWTRTRRPGGGSLARGLVDRGREPGPPAERLGRPEPGHVPAGLGDDHLGHHLPAPGDGLQQGWC
jgi:hypothetical protein